MSTSLVTEARPGWTDAVAGLVPGAHVAVLANVGDLAGVEGRMIGLELRDTIAVLRQGPQTSFVLLFRKPIAQPTIIDQIMATGTGLINVEACRVESATPVQRGAGAFDKGNRFFGGHGADEGQYEKGTGRIYDNNGRWPSNVVLVHSAGCSQGNCERDCPARVLDAQSGETSSVASFRGERHGNVYGGGKGPSGPSTLRGHSDSGGASRFFPQFKDNDELRAWVERLIERPTFSLAHP